MVRGAPSIDLKMTDLDVVKQAADMMHVKVGPPYKPKGKDYYKLQYKCSARGMNAIGWMQTIYTFMGERRRAKIRLVLEGWKTSNYSPRITGVRKMSSCHPDRKMSAKGLCKQCYQVKWHLEHKRA